MDPVPPCKLITPVTLPLPCSIVVSANAPSPPPPVNLYYVGLNHVVITKVIPALENNYVVITPTRQIT